VTDVAFVYATEQPSVDHSADAASYQTHVGTGIATGHAYVMEEPLVPGPQANVRWRNVGPQYVESTKEYDACATVGGAPSLSVSVETDVPSGATRAPAALDAGAPTTTEPTTPVYDTGVALAIVTVAGPVPPER